MKNEDAEGRQCGRPIMIYDKRAMKSAAIALLAVALVMVGLTGVSCTGTNSPQEPCSRVNAGVL